jgi:hypothetical protein
MAAAGRYPQKCESFTLPQRRAAANPRTLEPRVAFIGKAISATTEIKHKEATMTNFNTLSRQGGKATPLGLVVKVVAVCAVGSLVALVATSVAKNRDQLAKLPLASAHAAGTPPAPLPSSAQAKSWDPVQYAPDDFKPRPGQIED